MNCPKCSEGMQKVRHSAIEIDRCRGCGGIWFDLLELEKLVRQEGSARIDTGNPDTGEKFDKVGRIDCPVCHSPMIRMVDANQPHIRYEACKICSGVFLDAGEFTDLADRTLVDRLRDFFAAERA